jgi:hypothetical protein
VKPAVDKVEEQVVDTEETSPGVVIGERTEPLPAWVNDKPGPRETMVTSDPYPTANSAREDAEWQLAEWLEERIDRQTPGSIDSRCPVGTTAEERRKKFIRSEHVERRNSSVGEVFVVRLLGEINETDEQELVAAAHTYVAEQRRVTGQFALTAGGAGVLALLAAIYGVLSIGGKTSH